MKTNYPKVSIVTPSYNQAQYLEQTIESVLNQNYPNLEYFVLDGGSTDGSVDIIKKYSERLTYWHSKPDKGQTDAIIQGFSMAQGEIFAWINSDDYYEPGAIHKAVEFLSEKPDSMLVYGDYFVLYPGGERVLKKKVSFDFNICLYAYLMIPQPSAFWRRSAYEAVGGLNLNWEFCQDFDLFLRMGQRFPKQVSHMKEPLSVFRVHATSKSVDGFAKTNRVSKEIRKQFTSSSPFCMKIKKYFYLGLVELRFLFERGYLPLRKDKTKA